MLDLEKIDLVILAEALEDQSSELTWWLNTETGDLTPDDGYSGYDSEEDDLEGERLEVSSFGSRDAYRDMQDFIATCQAGVLQDRLSRAIAGRGAFRRFRDTLYEYPEAPKQWQAFHDYRIQSRAIRWLVSREVVAASQGESALSALVEPQVSIESDSAEDQEYRQLARLKRIESTAQVVIDEALAIGWLGSASTTLPSLEQSIRELAESFES